MTFVRSPDLLGIPDSGQLAVGDFNNDAKPDLLFGSTGRSNLLLFLGNGNGTFQSGLTIATPTITSGAVAVADFNHDGFADAATTTGYAAVDRVYIAFGKGDGTTQPQLHSVAVGYSAWGMATADFNNDLRTDLVVGNDGTSAVAVVLATPAQLSDGIHTFNAWSEDLAGNKSAMSAPLAVTIDTVGPTVQLDAVTPNPRTMPVSADGITFNEAVAGLATSLSPHRQRTPPRYPATPALPSIAERATTP